MSAMVLPHPGNLPPLALPAIVEEDDILIHLSKPVQLNVKIGEESFSAVGNHGSFSTVPNHVPTTWHMLEPTEFFVLSVRHELLTRVALEVLDIDPKHVRLAGKVAEEDPFIYQVSQLILGEIKTQGIGWTLIHRFADAISGDSSHPQICP